MFSRAKMVVIRSWRVECWLVCDVGFWTVNVVVLGKRFRQFCEECMWRNVQKDYLLGIHFVCRLKSLV